MKSKFIFGISLIVLACGVWSCQDSSPTSGATPGGTISQVQGKVFDNTTRLPIPSSTVYISSTIGTDSVRTSPDGAYTFNVDLNRLTFLDGSLQVRKNGYRSKTLNFSVLPGNIVYNDVFLDRDTTTGVRRDAGTGTAHSIALVSLSSNQISVYGVGGAESSILTWEVRDSLGFPIDIDHSDTVTFQIMGAPTFGGAYVSPASVVTNAAGRVATIVNSGTVSGALQFVAQLRREIDGGVIQSTPILITVNGGLPDQAHFTIAPVQINFAAYDWEGRENPMTVQVGDRYSNPVHVGTAVYFNTTGGVVVASGFTDATSHATVILYSGNPKPDDAVKGKGFAYVRASTIGQGGATVEDSVLVLFSGVPIISNVNPNTFVVLQGQSSGPINFTVADENGNPLAPGTVISVTVQYTPPPSGSVTIVATGDISTVLGDTQARGQGITQFTIRVVDQSPNGGSPNPVDVGVVISVNGPNGRSPNYTINGTVGG